MTLPDAPKHKWHENPYDDRPRYDDTTTPINLFFGTLSAFLDLDLTAPNHDLAAISRRFTEDMDEIARGC